MEKKSILQAKREQVDQLQKEVQERFKEKQKLESLARGEQAREIESKRTFTTVGRLFGRGAKQQSEVLTVERAHKEVAMDDNTLAWLRQHAPEKLPPAPARAPLDLKQQAQWAHHEYCDADRRLQRAKAELSALEKKIREARELAQCFAEVV